MGDGPTCSNLRFARWRVRTICLAAVVLWMAGLCYGIGELWRYESQPGQEAIAPAAWPQSPQVALAGARYNLVLFIHPHCPCSRATIRELARLMAHAPDNLSARVLFVSPPGVAANWASTDLWRAAAAIPGVAVELDSNAKQAQRFGARTSGQALLYDTKGQLLFSGGITASRGHEGDNDGESAILELLAGATPRLRAAPVYGCALLDDAALPIPGGPECRNP
jgi:hypothetical protein